MNYIIRCKSYKVSCNAVYCKQDEQDLVRVMAMTITGTTIVTVNVYGNGKVNVNGSVSIMIEKQIRTQVEERGI